MRSTFFLSWLLPRKVKSCHTAEFMQCVVLVLAASLPIISCEERMNNPDGSVYHQAEIKYSYYDPKKPHEKMEASIPGAFAMNLTKAHVKQSLHGRVVLVTSTSYRQPTRTDHLGCTADYKIKVPQVEWIALVQRGDCGFTEKINYATKNNNASTVLIYDNHTEFTVMRHKADNKNAVLISLEDGERLKELLMKDLVIEMEIYRGEEAFLSTSKNEANQSSVVFVAISFCIILVISVAWLMFYYIRKFRYSHAKEKLARRLARAAKKAIAKIPQRTVSAGDKELEGEFDQCAVCIEPYKDGDVIRTLPCRHVFHKSCVDPWLLDHRTCPMCKLDILQAYGMSYNLDILSVYGMQGSQDSVHREVAGAGAVSPGQGAQSMVLNDPEVSSSLDGESPDSNPELKVVLVPHSCLHYHHHHHHGCQECGDEEEEDVEAGASASLLPSGVQSLAVCCEEDDMSATQSLAKASAAVGSSSSLNSRSGRNHSKNRASLGKETSIEMEALISNPDDANITSMTTSLDLNSGIPSANTTSASALGCQNDEQRHKLEESAEKGKSPNKSKTKRVADQGDTERRENADGVSLNSANLRTAVASVHELGPDAGQSEA